MNAVTSIPFDNLTRAILRKAELGFFGVIVFTCKHTPRLNGELFLTGLFLSTLKLRNSAGVADFLRFASLAPRNN
jgi:hypothetical protein